MASEPPSDITPQNGVLRYAGGCPMAVRAILSRRIKAMTPPGELTP